MTDQGETYRGGDQPLFADTHHCNVHPLCSKGVCVCVCKGHLCAGDAGGEEGAGPTGGAAGWG